LPFVVLLGLVGFCALIPRRRQSTGERRARDWSTAPRFLVVIPAHDEEGNIAETVASCRAVHYDASRFAVVVIADNCTDHTARTSREAGAEIYERVDPDRVSKGYALIDFFRAMADGDRLARYDGVVLVDADTAVDAGMLSAFASALEDGIDWAQGYYTVRNPDASWRTRLLTYAFSLFNGAWLLGLDRLGLGANFRGNGMCLSTRGLARHPWRAHGLVEDQEFGWGLRLAGERIRFVPEARVYGEMVSRGSDAASQRQRWETGRRALRPMFFRPLLGSRALPLSRKALAVLDLFFPPLTILLAALTASASIYPLVWLVPELAPAAWRLLPWHAAMAVAVAAYALSPLFGLGLPVRYLGSLLALPYYAAWRVATTSRARATRWVRTQREAPAGSRRT
jgi:cellulose synthase/poly-beta-1,6-N-acetylglucosamine synthase-like glycosyltransferase